MFLGLYYSLLCACACACVLLGCEVNGVLWMAWKEGRYVGLASLERRYVGLWVWLEFSFCSVYWGFSLFFYLFYLIYGG